MTTLNDVLNSRVPYSVSTNFRSTEADRLEIARQIRDFRKAGGKIEPVPSGVSAHSVEIERTARGTRRYKKNSFSQITINPKVSDSKGNIQ